MKKTPRDIIILHVYNKNYDQVICTVPEIWCVMDVIIFHFGPLFALLPPNSPKNQNLGKMKKNPGDIIILHWCIKSYDQMIYSS